MASGELANANITRNNLFYQQRRLVKYTRVAESLTDNAQGGSVFVRQPNRDKGTVLLVRVADVSIRRHGG